MRQTTDHVLMVRPVNFGFNEETAVNNVFQNKLDAGVGEKALTEFDGYVRLLRQNGITVDVWQDVPEPPTPDSIFPNNCFSTHLDDEGNHVLVLYPMFARNRRAEREKLIPYLTQMTFDRVVDLRKHEDNGMALEGTGSLVLDRAQRIAYACMSPRTSRRLLDEWASQMGFEVVAFDSQDENGTPVYHTNVMMHVGTSHAVVCVDSVSNPDQRMRLVSSLEATGKTIVDISLDQMRRFAGNMLELTNPSGEKIIVMSQTARESLTDRQTALLEKDVRIVAPDIHNIETVGGGSARCMIAEMF